MNLNLKQKIGLRIKELRLNAGLKQAELAEKVNIATKHQSCIETGKNFPSSELLEKYAWAFKIDIADLLIISHYKERNEIEKELISFIKNSNQEQLQFTYKILKGIFI